MAADFDGQLCGLPHQRVEADQKDQTAATAGGSRSATRSPGPTRSPTPGRSNAPLTTDVGHRQQVSSADMVRGRLEVHRLARPRCLGRAPRATGTALKGTYTNLGTVTATPPVGPTKCHRQRHEWLLRGPLLHRREQCSWMDSVGPPRARSTSPAQAPPPRTVPPRSGGGRCARRTVSGSALARRFWPRPRVPSPLSPHKQAREEGRRAAETGPNRRAGRRRARGARGRRRRVQPGARAGPAGTGPPPEDGGQRGGAGWGGGL